MLYALAIIRWMIEECDDWKGDRTIGQSLAAMQYTYRHTRMHLTCFSSDAFHSIVMPYLTDILPLQLDTH